MKKLSLLIATVSVFSMVKGQNNSFVQNAVWYTQYSDSWGGCTEYYVFNDYFNGDTLINGNQYFKLYEHGRHDPGSCLINTSYFTQFKGFVRYDQKKILVWNNNHDTVFLDYNLHVGDSIHNVDYLASYPWLKLKITSIDSVLINGVYLRRFYYQSNENSMMVTHYIIEMIGSYHGFISRYTNNFEENSSLSCYAENNTVLYTTNSSNPCILNVGIQENSMARGISIFPNPTSGTLSLSSPGEAILELRVCNAFGQKIIQQAGPAANIDVSALSPGIYLLEIETASGMALRKFIRE